MSTSHHATIIVNVRLTVSENWHRASSNMLTTWQNASPSRVTLSSATWHSYNKKQRNYKSEWIDFILVSKIKLYMSLHSISSLTFYLMAFSSWLLFWLLRNCYETVDRFQPTKRSRRAGPSATAHTCYMYFVTYWKILRRGFDLIYNNWNNITRKLSQRQRRRLLLNEEIKVA